MIEALRFVKGAVSKKDYQPALSHFRIKDGRVTGYNGTIALSSPIALDITACPRADLFVKAIERCESTTAVHVTPAGKLSLKSGKFTAFVDCTEEGEVLDAIVPEGDLIQLTADLIEPLTHLQPFVGTDASRPWATGVLLRGYSAFAANNIIVAEYWIGESLPEINLPSMAVTELLRIKEKPTAVSLSQNSITFFFNGGRWMRSQLLGTGEWPLQMIDILLSLEADLQPMPTGIFEAIDVLVPFVGDEGRIHFRDGELRTSPLDGEGYIVEFAGLPARGAYHYKHLMSLQGIATEIDFTKHPQPCPFRGAKLRGVIQGMRDE